MGCGASLPEGGGAAGLRPFLIQRLEDVRLRRQTRPIKASDTTPSKKELLMQPEKMDEDDDNLSSSHTNSYKTPPITPVKNAGDHIYKGEEEDDRSSSVDDDDDRRIRRGDGETPGSPSFRVYFNEDGTMASKGSISSDDTTQSTGSPERKKKARRGRKRRSFRMVIPRGGQVKSLLNVTSCYTPSHDQARLLPTKIASN